MRDDTAVSISEDNARSGVTGHNVRYVLAAGLAASVVGMMLVAWIS